MTAQGMNDLNAILAEHCFNHNVPLLQFGLVAGTVTSTVEIISVVADGARYVTDDWQSWAGRCLAGAGGLSTKSITVSQEN
jgi:hypothetical protein